MFRTWTPKRYLIKAAKIIGWVGLSVLTVLLLLIAAIQIPAVQNRIVKRTIFELEQKLGTKVALGHIAIAFPKEIVLEELYVEDQSHDTLLYAGELAIDTDLFALLKKRIQVNNISLHNWKIILSRSSDVETFNYDFIPAAFNTDPSEAPDTTATPWSFDIKTVQLTHVSISYHDSRLGNEIDATIGKLFVDVEELDLEEQHLRLNSVDFENSTINAGFSGSPQNVPDSIQVDSDAKPFAYDIETASFRNVTSTIRNVSMEEILRVDLGEFNIDVKKFDLVKREIDIEKVLLSNSFVSFQHTGLPIDSTTNSKEDKGAGTEPAWLFSLNSIELKNNSFQYYDFNSPAIDEGLDLNNLWLRGINLKAKNLFYNTNKANGEIELFSFQEKGGFTLSTFKATFALTERELDVPNFEISTPHSKIQFEIKSQFPSFETIADTYPEAMLTLKSRSSVGIRDLLYFNSRLFDSIPLKLRKDATVALDTHLEGKIKDLDIRQFRINAFSDTRLSVVGNIKGLPDKKAVIHASVDNFSTTGRDLKAILDDSVLSKFGLPNRLSLKGTYDGTFSTPSVKAELTSDIGSARINANLNLEKKGKETYGGNIEVRQFQLGRVLKNDDLGNVDMRAEVTGSGTSMKNLNAHVKVLVNKLPFTDLKSAVARSTSIVPRAFNGR